jgi:fatty acid desaturase
MATQQPPTLDDVIRELRNAEIRAERRDRVLAWINLAAVGAALVVGSFGAEGATADWLLWVGIAAVLYASLGVFYRWRVGW